MAFLSKTGFEKLWEYVSSGLNKKVNKVDGKQLSTNDYTTAEKEKLAGIAVGANKTVVDTELSDTSENPVQNKVVSAALKSAGTSEPWIFRMDCDASGNGVLGYYESDGTYRTLTLKRISQTNEMEAELGTLIFQLLYDEVQLIPGYTQLSISPKFVLDLGSLLASHDNIRIIYTQATGVTTHPYTIQGRTDSFLLDELGSLSFAFGRTTIRIRQELYSENSGAEEPT